MNDTLMRAIGARTVKLWGNKAGQIETDAAQRALRAHQPTKRPKL